MRGWRDGVVRWCKNVVIGATRMDKLSFLSKIRLLQAPLFTFFARPRKVNRKKGRRNRNALPSSRSVTPAFTQSAVEFGYPAYYFRQIGFIANGSSGQTSRVRRRNSRRRQQILQSAIVLKALTRYKKREVPQSGMISCF